MSQRQLASTPGRGLGAGLGAIARSIEALADRVRRLEATVSGQTAPADTRFEREVDPDTGELTVYIRRVSTGNREKIAGPL